MSWGNLIWPNEEEEKKYASQYINDFFEYDKYLTKKMKALGMLRSFYQDPETFENVKERHKEGIVVCRCVYDLWQQNARKGLPQISAPVSKVNASYIRAMGCVYDIWRNIACKTCLSWHDSTTPNTPICRQEDGNSTTTDQSDYGSRDDMLSCAEQGIYRAEGSQEESPREKQKFVKEVREKRVCTDTLHVKVSVLSPEEQKYMGRYRDTPENVVDREEDEIDVLKVALFEFGSLSQVFYVDHDEPATAAELGMRTVQSRAETAGRPFTKLWNKIRGKRSDLAISFSASMETMLSEDLDMFEEAEDPALVTLSVPLYICPVCLGVRLYRMNNYVRNFIFDQGNLEHGEKIYTPDNLGVLFICTAQTFVMPVSVAGAFGFWSLFCVSLAVYITSIVHWSMPRKGIARALDMAAVQIAAWTHLFFFVFYPGLNPYFRLVYCLAWGIGPVLYIMSLREASRLAIKRSAYWHAAMHVVGSICNTAAYFGAHYSSAASMP